MGKYIVKADIVEGGNPEYAPGKELRDGLENDGFLLMTMKDGAPCATVMVGISTIDLARMLAGASGEGGSVVRQAIAVADGMMKAAEIEEEYTRMKHAREIADMLMKK